MICIMTDMPYSDIICLIVTEILNKKGGSDINHKDILVSF